MESAASFKERLDSVNKELNDILSHNESVKEQLHSRDNYTYSYNPSTVSNYDAIMGHAKFGGQRPPQTTKSMKADPSGHSTASGGTDEVFAAAATPQATAKASSQLLTSRDLLQAEIRELFAAESRQMSLNMQAIAGREWDAKIREVDAILKNRFGELRSANESLQRVVTELADEVGHVNETLSNRLEKMEADLLRKINSVRREHEESLRQLKADARELADTLVAAKLDSVSIEKRSDELGRKLQDNIAASLRVFDQKWNTLEDQIDNNFRTERKQHALFVDKVEKALFDHTEQLRSDGAKIASTQQEVATLGEEAVGFRSQLRVARSELNQLEMLVRSLGIRQQQAAADKGKPHHDPLSLAPNPTANDIRQKRDDAPWEGGAMPFGEGIRLQQDVYALKQSVAYLADVVERKIINNQNSHHSTYMQIPSFISRQSGPRSPTKYPVPESDEDSNVNLARSSID